MPTIQSTPFLSISFNPQGFATVTVAADVVFASNESPLTARADCRVLGDDPVRDDFIFAFETHFFAGNPAPAQSVRFERSNVPRGVLNEDAIGAEEIVGEVTVSMSGGASVKKRTNVFQIR